MDSHKERLYTERVIPVRVICSQKQIEKIIDFTILHYRQLAVLAYRISDKVILKHTVTVEEKEMSNERERNAIRHAAGLPGGHSESYGDRYHRNDQVTHKSYGEVSSDGNRYQVIDNMVFRNGSYHGRKDELTR